MKRSKSVLMSSVVISIVFSVAMFLWAAPVSSQGKDAYQVQHTARFSPGDLTWGKFSGYDVVELKGGYYSDELGKPMLPAIQLQVALPAGMRAQSVQVINTTREEISGQFNLLPVQPPRRIGDDEDAPAFVEPDPEIYSSNQPYPPQPVEFFHQTDLAGQGMAVLGIYPLQYLPAEKKLVLYTSISFVIQGVGGYECSHFLSPNISERGRITYEQMVKDMVTNPEEVQLRTGLTTKSTMLSDASFDHVVITGSLHASWYAPLVEWHNQKGVRDTVVTIDWIYSNYTGSTDQEKVRNFIIDANTNWGTYYFLLGGEAETVPFEYRSYAGEVTPSDQYYTDFNDNWTQDVFVGRSTGESGFEIQTFVFKVLKYEKDPPRTDYPLNVLLIGMDLDDFTPAEFLKESIDGYIPPIFNVTKVYDSDPWPPHNHRDEAIAALNAGQNLVNHADHSNWNVMCTGDFNHSACIYSSDVDNLTNTNKMSVIVTIGCLPNYMDTTSDCIGEHFVIYNPNKAAVSFHGNTRDGFYLQGQPISRSGLLDLDWWISLFGNNMYNQGQTLTDAKNNFPNSVSGDRHCEWTFNLLGEPEMPIWTDEPDSFDVICPDTLGQGKIAFPVNVKDWTTHAFIESAYVCLWKEGDLFETGYTDVNGDVILNPSPASVGSLWVTVTKHNYIPCQQVAQITFVCGDFNTPGGDGVVNVSDLVYLVCYLYRGCPPPEPIQAADCNIDDIVNVADLVCLVNYLYRGGYPPCSPPIDQPR
jgi:hypothetical protein